MNIFFRVLLAVYGFFLTIISLIAMVVTLKPVLFHNVTNYLEDQMKASRSTPVAMFIIEFVFFIISLVFLLSGFKSNKDKKSVSKHTNIGEIKISLNSIESIAHAASRKLNGVRETKAYVQKLGDEVSIVIKVVVLPEINIPLLSEDIQAKVKKAVEESSGVRVADVNVLVDNIYTGYKARVE